MLIVNDGGMKEYVRAYNVSYHGMKYLNLLSCLQGARDIPKTADAQLIRDYRNGLFAAFSASVEVGLQDYRGDDGPTQLMRALTQRYSSKEAQRQACLLFGLMEKNQPTIELTRQLAAFDNGSITRIVLQERGSGYAPGYGAPEVQLPPPDAGEQFSQATARAALSPSGRLLRIDVVNRGQGYLKQPTITINPPAALRFRSLDDEAVNATQAEAKAFLFRSGPNKGRIDRIQLTNPGSGYSKGEIIRIRISPPETRRQQGGVAATATAILEYEVSEIKIINNGTGYAVERPVSIQVDPPPITARVNLNDPIVVSTLAVTNATSPEAIASRVKSAANKAGNCVGRACYDQPVVATAYPESNMKERSIFNSFRKKEDRQKAVRVADGGEIPQPINFDTGSKEMLALLPAGVGLVFNPNEKRYDLEVDPDYQDRIPLWVQGNSRRKIDPDFGPRGRAPIEREMSLSSSTFLRFMLSGAVCCSAVHLALTPIDVVKTKVQTDPERYSGLLAFRQVYDEEGLDGFFQGWQPTFVGFFFWGGVSYALTELVRRLLTAEAGAQAAQFEVPIILFAASMGAFLGSFIICPFESVRIRSVSQKDYAPTILGVLNRMVNEEGVKSLFAAVPLVLAKELPFAMAKFTVFDLSTLWLYNQFPAAREDLQLSLLISLVGGTLGGIAAAVVSNPADVTISVLKKAKSEVGPMAAATMVLEKGGPASLFTGLPLRMVFYSLVVSLQFLIYDSVRFALGIGTDDLKLYLNVLGGALNGNNGAGNGLI